MTALLISSRATFGAGGTEGMGAACLPRNADRQGVSPKPPTMLGYPAVRPGLLRAPFGDAARVLR